MQSEVFKDPIVFFDGICNLCNSVVLFFLDRNRKGNLKFVSLQSMAAERILGKKVGLNDSPSSILFLEDGILYQKSNAILKISAHLCFPWNIFPLFKWVPGCIRDYIYDWIARNRYRWFGRLEICRIPDPSLKHRFLDD
ncbi:PF04134 family protein [Leptospira interrogans str. 2003000735]|uniref:PF04134 family protein n=1 Tax=Leptospira interrogans str. 2002000626 TaxID=996803 RepID=A0A829CST6_LEPIR|nr:DCC1-like thiol-disulfide oxidoreductase family protein [Leptospira interrogans]EMY03272.1 PF04134 family protein [Leptospira interrogans str. 2002000626]EKN89428.1 PF04134 family protein [Leptospira interrogans str. 2002000624]EKQ38776.1 PF04134 family protein [Leptospira interrogans str. 2002000621]EKQ45472.1 PF04134 family protein [Leptospira interrogans str. 2002000623]EMJ66796.1 PF04134 family protein [Leptospira interrogans str. 2003000735]